MANTLSVFDRAIPGQSLTREPGSAPWERPPKYTDPMDVLEMYMEKLTDEEVIDNITDMLELGVPVTAISGSMLTSGAMNGLHTVDVKVLLNPVLAVHIKGIADVLGIDYKMTMDDYRDKDAEAKEKRRRLIAAKLKDRMGDAGAKKDTGDIIMEETQQQLETGELTAEPKMDAAMEAAPEMQEEMPMDEGMEMEQEMPTEEPAGLMARGN